MTPHRLSSKAVLFGRLTDPKAVVKIVGDCRWGAIAAVTTARRLQIRVHNTANGREWEHNHDVSGLAPSGCAGETVGAILMKYGYTPENIERIIGEYGDVACGKPPTSESPLATPPPV